jgi:hypothetical protein
MVALKPSFLLLLLLLSSDMAFAVPGAPANGGGEGLSGGGDLCEDRFKSVALDLLSWINQDGPKGLKLSNRQRTVTVEQYESSMKSALGNFQASCVNPGDPGFPVMVNGTPKECASSHGPAGKGLIVCDRAKFYSSLANPDNDDGQYRIVHHEFATLAGLELPQGADSDYWISDQIAGFLSNETVHKLSVVPAPTNDPRLGDFSFSLANASPTFALAKDRRHFAYATDNGIILMDLLTRHSSLPFPAQDVASLQFSPGGELICALTQKNSARQGSCFSTTSGRALPLPDARGIFFADEARSFIVINTGKIELRSLDSWAVERSFPLPFALTGNGALLETAALSADASLLAIAVKETPTRLPSRDNVYLFDLSNGKLRFKTEGSSASFRADGKALAVAVNDDLKIDPPNTIPNSGVHVLDPASGREIFGTSLVLDGPTSVEYLPDGRVLETFPGYPGQECQTDIISVDGNSGAANQDVFHLPCGSGPSWQHMDEKRNFFLGGLSTAKDLAVFDLHTGHPFGVLNLKDELRDSYVLSADRALAITYPWPASPLIVTLSVIEIPPTQ